MPHWRRTARRDHFFQECVLRSGSRVCTLFSSASAYPRQGIANQHVDDPAAAITGGDENGSLRLLTNFADNTRLVTTSGLMQNIQSNVGIFRSNDSEKLAFVCDMQWIETEQFTGPTHRVPDRNFIFEKMGRETAVAGKFIQRCGNASTSRITHPAHTRCGAFSHGFYKRKDGTRIRLKVRRLQVKFAARQQNGDAMIANWPGEDNLVPCAHGLRAKIYATQRSPNARGRDIHVIRFAVFHNFGITANYSYSGVLGCHTHGTDLCLQHFCGQAGFENKCDDNCIRPCTGYCQVIDGAVNRQLSDRATWKAQRAYNKTVRGDRDTSSIDGNVRRIAKRLQS